MIHLYGICHIYIILIYLDSEGETNSLSNEETQETQTKAQRQPKF